mgnify:CR=1 FL=1
MVREGLTDVAEIRDLAREMNLPNADKPDSAVPAR